MTRSSKIVAALLALVLLAAACTSEEGADPADTTEDTVERDESTTTEAGDEGAVEPTFEKAECPESDYYELDEMDAFCGTVEVPENYDEPDGATVTLVVMVLPSLSDDPEPDPVVYLDGGPGGDGFSNAATLAETPARDDRHIILYTQRGTGVSTPSLNCDNSDAAFEEFLPLEPDSDEAEELGDELFVECRDTLLDEGIDLQQYNSANSAKDLTALRIALGEELGFDEWNLLGISYGTRLALTALRDEPDGIRTATIDSVYPPTRDLSVEVAVNAQAAFDNLFERCAQSLECDAKYPDLAQRWEDLVDELEADPVTVEAEGLITDDIGGEVLIDGDTLIGAMFQMLYISDLVPLLPAIIAQLEDGDFDYFASVAIELGYGSAEGISEGMYYSVQCQEAIPFSKPEDAQQALDALDPDVARVFDPESDKEDCETWGVDPSGPIENEPVSSDVPTLVMSGGFDPITPVSWAQEAAETLTNHWFVVVESGAHGSSLDACGGKIHAAFLDDPEEDPTLPCASVSASDLEWE